MKLPVSIALLASVLLIAFFVERPHSSTARADTSTATPEPPDAPSGAIAQPHRTAPAPHPQALAFGAVPSIGHGDLLTELPQILPKSFYDGATTEVEKKWVRSKTQFRLTLLNVINVCLQGENVGEGTVDIEVHFDNRATSSVVTDVTAFPHDNPSAPELNAAGTQRVLSCARDGLLNRPFQLSYDVPMNPDSYHRVAIKLPIANDPVYEFLRGGNWDE